MLRTKCERKCNAWAWHPFRALRARLMLRPLACHQSGRSFEFLGEATPCVCWLARWFLLVSPGTSFSTQFYVLSSLSLSGSVSVQTNEPQLSDFSVAGVFSASPLAHVPFVASCQLNLQLCRLPRKNISWMEIWKCGGLWTIICCSTEWSKP